MSTGHDDALELENSPSPPTYFDKLRAVATCYFEFWKSERDVILDNHKRKEEALSAQFGVSVRSIAESLGDRPGEEVLLSTVVGIVFPGKTPDEIPATSNDHHELWSWLALETNHYHGGLLSAQLTSQLVPIFSPREILAFDEQHEDVSERPPVLIWKSFQNKPFGARTLSVPGSPITRDRMPDDVGAQFDKLMAAVKKFKNVPMSVGVEGPEVRGAYRTFARMFHLWAIGAAELKTPRNAAMSVAPIESDYFPMCSTIAERAMLNAIYSASDDPESTWKNGQNGPTFIYRQPQGIVEVSLRDNEISAEKVARDTYAELKKYDDLTADVFLALLAHWTDRRNAEGYAFVTADAILQERNILPKTKKEGGKRYKSGYRPEDREEVVLRVDQLGVVWITLHSIIMYEGFGKKRKATKLSREGHYFVIDERLRQEPLNGSEPSRIIGWRYKLGAAAVALAGDRQFTYIARQVLAYDYKRRIPEKRLARYFAFHHRIAKGAIKCTILDLLQECVPPKFDPLKGPSRPQRVQTRFAEAMDRLKNDGVIGGWSYAHGRDPRKLPARDWFNRWSEWVVEVTPAETHPSLPGWSKVTPPESSS